MCMERRDMRAVSHLLAKLAKSSSVIAAGIAFALMCVFAAQAQETLDQKMTKSLVHIVVEAMTESPPVVGVPKVPEKVGEGTGFIVSEDGLILTNFHLISKLPPTSRKTVTFKVSFRENHPDPTEVAQFVKADADVDIMMLKVPEQSESKYVPVTLGSAHGLGAGAKLYTLGFPHPENPTIRNPPMATDGNLKSRQGPSPYLWTTELTINGGQSGSPIFTEDGDVVGIAKADSNTNSKTSFVIPIHFADSLISHVRMEKMQKSISQLNERVVELSQKLGEIDRAKPIAVRLDSVEGDLSDIQRFYEWSGVMTKDGLLLEFSKLVEGGPSIASLSYEVTPIIYHNVTKKIGTKETIIRERMITPSFGLNSINIAENIGKASTGNILISEIVESVNGLKIAYKNKIIDFSVKIAFVPISTLGDPLNKKNLTLSTDFDEENGQ
jgi:Trypsin-like peptidase domain